MKGQPKAVRHFRLPIDLNYELDEASDQLGISPSVFLRKATRGYLKLLKDHGRYTPQDSPYELKREVVRKQ